MRGIYGIKDKTRIEETLTLVGLSGRNGEMVRGLSAGWRQRLALAIALVHQPRLLFLDEPTSGVDPVARREFWNLIYRLAENGVTLFITTHYMDEAEYCSRVGLMKDGRLLAFDKPSILKTTVLNGQAWEVAADSLMDVVENLAGIKEIIQTSLMGDLVHLVASHGSLNENSLRLKLTAAGIKGVKVTPAEITLEDIFMSLTH